MSFLAMVFPWYLDPVYAKCADYGFASQTRPRGLVAASEPEGFAR
jgi:hypothetical protein